MKSLLFAILLFASSAFAQPLNQVLQSATPIGEGVCSLNKAGIPVKTGKGIKETPCVFAFVRGDDKHFLVITIKGDEPQAVFQINNKTGKAKRLWIAGEEM